MWLDTHWFKQSLRGLKMISINIINQFDAVSSYQETIVSMIEFAYQALDIKKDQIINFILINNEEMKSYNHQYRGIDQTTDVLSFENNDFEDEIGDVFISIERTLEQAKLYGHTFERELAFLSLHGYLHCLGYDHMTKDEELIMFQIQDSIIEKSKFRREDHDEQSNV